MPMIVGLPKEVKNHEYRVGLIPSTVHELTHCGHMVLVEKNAGVGSGVSDDEYRNAGATIVDTATEVYAKADMIVKVKEPQPEEYKMLRKGQILFTYLHLAPDPDQTKALLASGCTAIAYETVTDKTGALPLLAPMSEVAGRLSVQIGAHYLQKANGGRGVLLGGVPGVAPAKVLVLGGGVAGSHAARKAMGLGAEVTVMDKSLNTLRQLNLRFGNKLRTVYSTSAAIINEIEHADLVIGSVLVPGAEAPKLVTKKMVKSMRPGSVMVDIAIDQGGCFETSHPTSHTDPVYTVDGVTHYCVTNMPGAVPRTSAFALNNATFPFIMSLANNGYKKALLSDPHLLNGLNVHNGMLTCKAVADALKAPYVDPKEALEK